MVDQLTDLFTKKLEEQRVNFEAYHNQELIYHERDIDNNYIHKSKVNTEVKDLIEEIDRIKNADEAWKDCAMCCHENQETLERWFVKWAEDNGYTRHNPDGKEEYSNYNNSNMSSMCEEELPQPPKEKK